VRAIRALEAGARRRAGGRPGCGSPPPSWGVGKFAPGARFGISGSPAPRHALWVAENSPPEPAWHHRWSGSAARSLGGRKFAPGAAWHYRWSGSAARPLGARKFAPRARLAALFAPCRSLQSRQRGRSQPWQAEGGICLTGAAARPRLRSPRPGSWAMGRLRRDRWRSQSDSNQGTRGRVAPGGSYQVVSILCLGAEANPVPGPSLRGVANADISMSLKVSLSGVCPPKKTTEGPSLDYFYTPVSNLI
jgi:hypothetical protein